MDINNKDLETEEFRNDWALALMTKGVIVKLTMSRWRGVISLQPEELGIKFYNAESRKTNQQYIDFGKQKLLPPEIDKEISYIESKARNNLKQYSFNTIWGNFVPFTAFNEWESENNKIRTDFFQYSENLGLSFNSVIDTIKSAYSDVAMDVWYRLHNTKSDPPQSFVSNFIDKVLEKMPSSLDIISSFKYDTTYFTIPVPSIVSDNLYRANQIKNKMELNNFETDLEKQTKEKIANIYLSKKEDLIDSFLNSTIKSMRMHISELCEDILYSISKEKDFKEISKAKKDKIQRTIEHVKILNFYDDKEIIKLLNELNFELDKMKGERDYDNISLNLKKIVDLSSKEIKPENFNPSISNLDFS